MYVHENPHHSLKLTQVLVTVIVVSFAFAAISIAYTAGRHSGTDSPTTVEVAPARL